MKANPGNKQDLSMISENSVFSLESQFEEIPKINVKKEKQKPKTNIYTNDSFLYANQTGVTPIIYHKNPKDYQNWLYFLNNPQSDEDDILPKTSPIKRTQQKTKENKSPTFSQKEFSKKRSGKAQTPDRNMKKQKAKKEKEVKFTGWRYRIKEMKKEEERKREERIQQQFQEQKEREKWEKRKKMQRQRKKRGNIRKNRDNLYKGIMQSLKQTYSFNDNEYKEEALKFEALSPKKINSTIVLELDEKPIIFGTSEEENKMKVDVNESENNSDVFIPDLANYEKQSTPKAAIRWNLTDKITSPIKLDGSLRRRKRSSPFLEAMENYENVELSDEEDAQNLPKIQNFNQYSPERTRVRKRVKKIKSRESKERERETFQEEEQEVPIKKAEKMFMISSVNTVLDISGDLKKENEEKKITLVTEIGNEFVIPAEQSLNQETTQQNENNVETNEIKTENNEKLVENLSVENKENEENKEAIDLNDVQQEKTNEKDNELNKEIAEEKEASDLKKEMKKENDNNKLDNNEQKEMIEERKINEEENENKEELDKEISGEKELIENKCEEVLNEVYSSLKLEKENDEINEKEEENAEN